jgi:hypothetical protein
MLEQRWWLSPIVRIPQDVIVYISRDKTLFTEINYDSMVFEIFTICVDLMGVSLPYYIIDE